MKGKARPLRFTKIFITGLAGPIIDFLYGEPFAEAAAGLAVIIWSVVFMFANILSTKVIVAFDKETSITKITALNLVINLVLNLYLLPRWGFIGACWATVATEALNFVLQLWVVQRIFGQKLLGTVLPKLIPPAAALGWFFLHPASFQTAGVWLFIFVYLVYLFSRRGQG
jgi:O-antigen/teichoic acid export membrane protein